jgi:5-oxoprolinase (ATP-hydrolysing) subunit C
MSVLTIVEAGSSSVQGLGNYGGQRYGIAPGGAMDRFALAEANALVSLPAGAAAIEIGPLPFRIAMAENPIRFALSGAKRDVRLNDLRIELNSTVLAGPQDILSVRGANDGQFSYLAIQGGLQASDQKSVSLSRSGRSWVLQAGEVIPVLPAVREQPEFRLPAHSRSSAPIRVVLGPHLDQFATSAVNRFLSTTWSVSTAADRMAYILDGGRVEALSRPNRISDGMVTGNIQIAGSGQPLVILCDRGTVGGYPKIATIITADLGRFVQTPLCGQVRFAPVSVVEAQALARDFTHGLANLKTKVKPVAAGISLPALLECNLAGEVVDAGQWFGDVADSPERGMRQ